MLFNSIEFAIFLPLVFLLYWFVLGKSIKLQNALLLAASYFFYGWWDWRFLSLIIFSSFVDFFIGRKMGAEEDAKKRKVLLWCSIMVNLGFLGFFKYYNFFAESFASAFTLFGTEFEAVRLGIVLPVGISFYTFQTLSYSIDIYRKKLEPSNDMLAFFAFVSFFPQLVAGPIERATNLLPQFFKERAFNYDLAANGMRQILWGLFKKIVIADNCAFYVNTIFSDYSNQSASTLLLGGVYFAFQIYGDFSGYSDIAIGTSRLFGFNLKQNFAFPYFSRDMAEFWRRWHISLSTWFRDYLYIPLGGSRGGNGMRIRNTFAIFLVSGFWHGANWTFLIWGFLNACYFLPLMLTNNNRKNLDVVAQGRWFPSVKELLQIGITFLLTVIAWIFFRAADVGEAFSYLASMASPTLFSKPTTAGTLQMHMMIFLMLGIEWWKRDKQYGLDELEQSPTIMRWIMYFVITLIITYHFLVLNIEGQQFIYFQF